MKLSQAMRAGCRKSTRAWAKYFDDNGGTCAIGAALLGIGINKVSFDVAAGEGIGPIEILAKAFPYSLVFKCCPVDRCEISGAAILVALIVHLNDYHHWSRERIAGWIESHVEVPTYSLLEMREYMEDPVTEKVVA